MRVLITGVAGFIGSHLAERLVAEDAEVLGVDRLTDYYDPALKRANLASLLECPRFEFRQADVNEVDVAELLDGVDVVYHLAAQPGVRGGWGSEFQTYVEANILSTQRLLRAASDVRLQRFVLASSSSVYGQAARIPTPEGEPPAPLTPYGVTKLAAEQLCRLYYRDLGVPAMALRYFSIFGPRQRPDMAFSRFIRAALAGEPIEVTGDGRQSRDFTFVADAVEVTIAAGSRGDPGAIYNVAGGKVTSLRDVIGLLERLVGREIAIDWIPGTVGEARTTAADTTAARERLSYAPRTGLEEGLRLQIELEGERTGIGAAQP
jgi:nucleoside-diphosphate-sugar epimerase